MRRVLACTLGFLHGTSRSAGGLCSIDPEATTNVTVQIHGNAHDIVAAKLSKTVHLLGK